MQGFEEGSLDHFLTDLKKAFHLYNGVGPFFIFFILLLDKIHTVYMVPLVIKIPLN